MSWATAVAPPKVFADEDERQLKLEFASLLVDFSGQASEAAYTLFPGELNYGRAWSVAEHWPHDPIVAAEVARLSEDGKVGGYLPTKDEFAKRVWDRSQQVTDPKIELSFLQLFGETMGYVSKGNNQNVNVNVVQNVIEVPTRASEEELPMLEGQWAEQQRRLIADARSSRPE